jgi:hypothetical protein
MLASVANGLANEGGTTVFRPLLEEGFFVVFKQLFELFHLVHDEE